MEKFPPDISELIKLLNQAGVEFILAGAHAVGYHGLSRATKDYDFFVRNSRENAERVIQALEEFIGPHSIAVTDLTHPRKVIVLGVEPLRVDLLTFLDGLDFESAWKNAVRFEYDGVSLAILSLADLIATKKASNRPQDIADLSRIIHLYPEKSVDL